MIWIILYILSCIIGFLGAKKEWSDCKKLDGEDIILILILTFFPGINIFFGIISCSRNFEVKNPFYKK